MDFRGLLLALVIAAVPGWALHGQSLSAPDNLAAGISQVRSGDFFGALITLNTVVTQTAERPGDAAILARAHAFRAQAYLGLDQPERARAAAALALKSDPGGTLAEADLPAAVMALLDDRLKPGAQNPEAVGDALNQALDREGAFAAYVKAYQVLPEPPSPADDQRLREKIIRLSRNGVAPVMPDEARAQMSKAQDLLDAEAILGSAPGVAAQQAAVALRQAIRLAPWSGEAAFRLATLLQKLNRVDEALLNLSLYRLADPDGYAARAGRVAAGDTAARSAAATPPPAAPKPGPALIYIYWPEQQRGGGRQKVHCNGQQVAELQNNRYLVLRAAPGSHDLAFRDKHATAVVEAGGEYHFRASIEGHWQFAMGPDLHLVSAEAATAEMRDQSMQVNDAKHTRSAECALPVPSRGRPR